jgi:hypothetical protein
VATFDAQYSLQSLVRTKTGGAQGNFNLGRVSDPKLDTTIDAIGIATDPKGARRAAARGADRDARQVLLRADPPSAAAVGDEEERHHGAQGRRPAGVALRQGSMEAADSQRVGPRPGVELPPVAGHDDRGGTDADLRRCRALLPWLAPQNPFDAAALDLNAAFKPPAWIEGGERVFLLGTDNQGRDILSTIMHGARVSLGVGLASVLLSVLLGVSAGLVSGYFGGRIDAVMMRIADVQLSFPAILIALLIDGVPASRCLPIATTASPSRC